MIIQDRKGNTYTMSMEEWDRLIVKQGNAYKFHVVEDDAPVEVKQLRIKKANHGKEKKEGN